MRKLMRKILYFVGAYIGVSLAMVFASHHWKWALNPDFWIGTFIDVFAGVATFSAVIVSLFGNAIKRRFERPIVEISAACDDRHCDLVLEQDSSRQVLSRRRLDVYVSAINLSDIDAIDAQIVCTRAFVSSDGERFAPHATCRSASFRWLYSSDDNKFLTTLRHSVEKYAKVVEIVDAEECVLPDGKHGDESAASRKTLRKITYKIALQLNNQDVITVDSRYKAVLLSLCFSSSSTNPAHYYLKVYLRSGYLDALPAADRLEIKFLTKEEAQRSVAVSLD